LGGAEEGFGMEGTTRTRRRGSRVVLAVVLAAVAVATVSALALAVPQKAQAATAAEKLQELRVRPAGTMEGYSRDLFPHWSDAQEYGWKLPAGTPDPGSCDARDAALIRDGREEVVGSGCTVGSGRWFDPYTGTTYTQPSDIDVDHVVPLANAWRSGAASWTAAKKERFANIPRDVLSVEDNANQEKGDKGPEAWKPSRVAYHCAYSKKWIGIKHYWALSVTREEKSALKQMLSTCR
jgi:hypothetical protein